MLLIQAHFRWSIRIALFVLALPLAAEASETYPERIERELDLTYKPECTVCHIDDRGGYMTVTKPFGRQMAQLGTIAKSPSRMSAALHEYDGERYTVDGDNVPDVQELRDGTDPNRDDAVGEGGAGGVVPPGFEDLPIPQTGCGVPPQKNARSGDDLAETLVAFALATVSILVLRIGARGRRRAV